MSVFTNNILTKNVVDYYGFGVTLVNGIVTAVLGPKVRAVNGAPSGADNIGTLAIRYDGGNVSLYQEIDGAGTWAQFLSSGGGLGYAVPADVPVTFGADGSIELDTAGTDTWRLLTANQTAANSTPLQVATGSLTQAVNGAFLTGTVTIKSGNLTQTSGLSTGASGAVVIQSGDTDSTAGGATAAATGSVTIKSGNASSTDGTSGLTSGVTIGSGNSADSSTGAVNITSGNAGTDSGNIAIQTGTAGGNRGNIQFAAPYIALNGVALNQNATAYVATNYQTPLTGANVVLVASQSRAIIQPAGALLALTVTLPTLSAEYDGTEISIAITQSITTLTVAAGAATVTGAPSAITTYGQFTMHYRHANTTWYRVG